MLTRVQALAWASATLVACGAPPGDQAPAPLCEPRGPQLAWFSALDGPGRGLDFSFQPRDFRAGVLAVADLTGDGLPEIVLGSRAGGLAAFENRGGLRFAPWDGAATFPVDPAVDFVAAGDFDNDGDRDLVIADGQLWLHENQDGQLVRTSLISADGRFIHHILVADLNLDGWLDLYLSRSNIRDPTASANLWYRNGRNGTFVPTEVGAETSGLSWTASAFDPDRDGDPDLYIANDTLVADHGQGEPVNTNLPVDVLYRSSLAEQDVVGFVDETEVFGLTVPRSSMGGIVGDVNGDGMFDLVVPDLGANKAFVSQPDGSFVDRAAELGLAGPRRNDGACAGSDELACLLPSWGAQLGDFDLDGADDLIVVNGAILTSQPPLPILAFRGPAPYQEVDLGLGCHNAGGLVASDLDGDGDLDLVASVLEGPPLLFENISARPHHDSWFAATLIGEATNRDGLGAEVIVTTRSGERRIRRTGTGGVAFSQAPTEIHVGLGTDVLESVEVHWPTGAVQTLTAPLPSRLDIEEPP